MFGWGGGGGGRSYESASIVFLSNIDLKLIIAF
jgi:hypothetical protein